MKTRAASLPDQDDTDALVAESAIAGQDAIGPVEGDVTDEGVRFLLEADGAAVQCLGSIHDLVEIAAVLIGTRYEESAGHGTVRIQDQAEVGAEGQPVGRSRGPRADGATCAGLASSRSRARGSPWTRGWRMVGPAGCSP